MIGGYFSATSRYASVGTSSLTTADGKIIAYLLRRFLPQPAALQVLGTRTLREGERLDVVAAQSLGDPEQFWRLCDANNAMQPEELEQTPGLRIVITLPQGVKLPTGNE